MSPCNPQFSVDVDCQPVACIMAAIVAPAGDCSMAMTRDCFEPGLAFLPLGSIVVCCEGFAAPPAAADEATERFFTDFDMEILQSVKAPSRRTTEAPPRPSGRRGRISERPQRPELTTVPLQSQPNASLFWIMSLLIIGRRDRTIIAAVRCSRGSGTQPDNDRAPHRLGRIWAATRFAPILPVIAASVGDFGRNT
jgi:hypothetical protein